MNISKAAAALGAIGGRKSAMPASRAKRAEALRRFWASAEGQARKEQYSKDKTGKPRKDKPESKWRIESRETEANWHPID